MTRRTQSTETRPYFFYSWSGEAYLLSHRGYFANDAEATDAGWLLARQHNGHHRHLHIIDEDQVFIATIGATESASPRGESAVGGVHGAQLDSLIDR